VNNLPKVVTQRCLEQNLNPRPTDRKHKCLTRCTTGPDTQWLKCYALAERLFQARSKGQSAKYRIPKGRQRGSGSWGGGGWKTLPPPGRSGDCCKLPTGVLSGAPEEVGFSAFGASKTTHFCPQYTIHLLF